MCFSCRGGPKWAPHTLGGASVEITWQERRLDEEYSKLHPDAGSHPEAGILEEVDSHPEVDLHPEVNMLALADKELHPGVDSHPVDSHPEVNMLALAI